MAIVKIDPEDIGMAGTCPVCCDDEHPIVHGAMMPLPVLGGVIQPHEYGVCDACFLAQFEQFYGFSFADRLKHKPSRFG